uniref:Immunoglobulin domain-containing protein n=1 Tax=Sinocyclocheilus anshuiensis TaxID=1608454 RepID=A0A671R175_9TELE
MLCFPLKKILQQLLVCVSGVSAAEQDQMKRKSVKEGESVTLDPAVIKKQNYLMKWYFNDALIAEITGDQSKICTDDQCEERFRDRLKLELDHQTGSLTITNTRTTESGLYKLQMNHSRISIIKIFSVTVTGDVGTDGLSAFVMEGDSVTLHTDVETKQQEDIKWYFDDTRIAQISGDLSFICTDVQCNVGNERFEDRLELDSKTGTLTIRDIRTTDSGLYELKIISISSRDEMKRKSVEEGESVTLHPGVMKNPNDLMTWYFNDICIAEINEEPRMICTDIQCNNGTERFRDRLKLDHQSGSLTITNTRTTDSGLYKLQITSSRFSIIRNFGVNVTVPGLSAGEIAGICAAAVLLLIAAPVFFCFYKCRVKRKGEYYISDGKSVFFSLSLCELVLSDSSFQKLGSKSDSIYINTR